MSNQSRGERCRGLVRRRWGIFLLSSRCCFHRSGWLTLCGDVRQPKDDSQPSSADLGGTAPYLGLRKTIQTAYQILLPNFSEGKIKDGLWYSVPRKIIYAKKLSLNIHLSKQEIQVAIMKRCSESFVIRWLQEQQCDNPTHLLEWQKYLMIQTAGKHRAAGIQIHCRWQIVGQFLQS